MLYNALRSRGGRVRRGRCQQSIFHMVDMVRQRDQRFAVGDDHDGHLTLHGLHRFSNLEFARHVDLAGRLV